jgi:hypothetical protein
VMGLCVAYVGGSAKLEQTCSKQRLFHLWFCDNYEVDSSWSLWPLCGPWTPFFTWLVLVFCGFGGF